MLLEDVDGDNVKWQGLDQIGDAGPRKKPEKHQATVSEERGIRQSLK